MIDPRSAEVRALLSARRAAGPVDAREEESIVRFESAMDALARPFDQDADATHVTSSAIVLSTDGERVLLLRHKRLGIWVQPGGHLEPGEDLFAGACREAREETGLTLASPGGPRLVHVDVHAGGRGHTHLDLRWLLIGTGSICPEAGEAREVEWCDWDAAIGRADPGLSGALVALQPPRT